jgi:hypothetical protein
MKVSDSCNIQVIKFLCVLCAANEHREWVVKKFLEFKLCI